MRRTVRLGVLVSVVALFAASCGVSSDSPTATTESAGQTASVAETPPDSVPTSPKEINACDLLTVDEVAQYLGETSDGTLSGNACEWLNPATDESVTLTVGSSGTAASGTLSAESDYGETEPVPEIGDTARYASGFGIVEFVAGGRASEIQVAVLDDTVARSGATALAVLAISRM